MNQPNCDPASGHTFLDALDERQRQLLTAAATPFRAQPGQFLAREGEAAHAFYLIHSGHVGIGTHLGHRGAAPLQTVGAGDTVGWSWLLPPYQWEFDARAIDVVEGLAFDAQWLRQQCESDYELGYNVLKQLLSVVSDRLTACRIHNLDIYK